MLFLYLFVYFPTALQKFRDYDNYKIRTIENFQYELEKSNYHGPRCITFIDGPKQTSWFFISSYLLLTFDYIISLDYHPWA